jgi:hypothetical protein
VKNKFITGGSLLLLIAAFTFGWIKENGDFAITSYVQQAKADTVQIMDNKMTQHENREAIQLNRIENKLDRLVELQIKD